MKSSKPQSSAADVALGPIITYATETVGADFAAAELPQAAQDRVRRRLMEGIAQDSTHRHSTTFASSHPWQPFLPGIECKVLQEVDGIMSYLLRLAPGAVLPAHRHPVDEECLVLSGALQIGTELELHEGDFHLGVKDIHHAAIQTVTGATIFLRGASPNPAQMI